MTNAYLLTTCAISLAILVVLWIGPIASLRRDNFRADIRRIRDDLFDFMLENRFSFEIKAYRDTRQALNGMLRASNWLSPVNLILAMFFHKWHGLESKQEFTNYDDCPPALKSKLLDTATIAVSRLIVFLFAEGTLGMLLRFALFVFSQSRKIDHAARRLTVELYSLGAPTQELTFDQRSFLRC